MVEYTVPVDGLTLSVRDHPGEAPPVVALHGLASNARWWDLVAPLLQPRRVVAVDQRGHGRSTRPESGYDFDAVVGDLRGLAGAMGLGPCVAMGHSWGASVALAWAAADAAGVRAVVCVDGGVGDLRGFFGATWEKAAVAMRPPELRGIEESTLSSWVARSGLAGDGDPAAAVHALRGNFEEAAGGGLRPRLSVERHMQIAYALYHLDSAALYAQVRVPVLFVLATRGGVAGADPRAAAVDAALAVLPAGSGVRWVDGGHDLPVQRPREVAGAVSSFLAGLAL
ncbi:MAG TPA: alpha/beta hydrolase [Candidatus Angelobacter sp.]|jgi:pimeloyl-ACP methyl ester carboxylesterase|nr:alpha/beta hydrolase [Candidatus Angelobacter sp.]